MKLVAKKAAVAMARMHILGFNKGWNLSSLYCLVYVYGCALIRGKRGRNLSNKTIQQDIEKMEVKISARHCSMIKKTKQTKRKHKKKPPKKETLREIWKCEQRKLLSPSSIYLSNPPCNNTNISQLP